MAAGSIIKAMAKAKQKRTLEQNFPWLLTIGGALGFFASFVLSIDKLKLVQDPNYIPNCNINPLISCGSVIKTVQSSVFGFPNSFIGIGGFAIVVTIGMLMLAGATNIKRWFWLGLELGAIFGVGLVHWLFFQTVYNIGALCPYCMVVWAVTIPIFWYTTLYNLRTGVIPTPVRLKGLVAFIQRHHVDILVVWILIIVGLILNHFWYYWQTLL
jgi:uncharacterized membrane protein